MDVIAIIGLGYVGTPLALLFSKQYPVIGFDIDKARIEAINAGNDPTSNIDLTTLHTIQKHTLSALLQSEAGLFLTADTTCLNKAGIFIITVPTPDTEDHCLDLSMLESACILVAQQMQQGAMVIIESTVYPGVTEDICIPLLEKTAGLQCNKDFWVAYSPERVNPGDTTHTLANIVKLTAGSDAWAAQKADALYASVITAGTHAVGAIRAAEMSKIVENAQRDVNIAFMNEIAQLCHAAGIDTQTVLQAAGTKWNFLPFQPGLVGGHCVGVASSYLQQLGHTHQYTARLLPAARQVNNSMSQFIAQEVLQAMLQKGMVLHQSKALVLGLSFKEGCADVRNSKIFEILSILQQQGVDCTVVDPWVDAPSVLAHYNVQVEQAIPPGLYDVILVAVAHPEFKHWHLANYKQAFGIIYDVKHIIDAEVDIRL